MLRAVVADASRILARGRHNVAKNVRALFVVGRPLASAEDITRQAEALFGSYIPERDYRERKKHGRIPSSLTTLATTSSRSMGASTPTRWSNGCTGR